MDSQTSVARIEIAIIMGSHSDWKVMEESAETLKEFGVSYEAEIVSAHRTPEYMFEYASSAQKRNIQVIIAGAGGAAHLPGMVASLTPLPVIGVPIRSSNSLDGWDSILSILQMPGGIPVATVALDQSKNAALLAIRILSVQQPKLKEKMQEYMRRQAEAVRKQSL